MFRQLSILQGHEYLVTFSRPDCPVHDVSISLARGLAASAAGAILLAQGQLKQGPAWKLEKVERLPT